MTPGLASPAEMRAFIIERLVGDTGEPDEIIKSAKSMASRAVLAIVAGLAEALELNVEIEVAEVELVRFASVRPTATGAAMTVASSPSSPDAMVLAMDPQALGLAVNLLFGGDPDQAAAAIDRDLSPTEVEVASTVFEQFALALNGSGSRAFELKMPLPAPFAGVELSKQIIRDGPGVRVVFKLVSPAGSGTVALTMPQRVLLKHRGDAKADAGARANEWRARFSEEVMRSSVELQASMPLARLTLGALDALQTGQIIEFDAGAQSRARLSARQKTLYVCEFGKLGQNYTLRVRHPFDAGQDLMEGLMSG